MRRTIIIACLAFITLTPSPAFAEDLFQVRPNWQPDVIGGYSSTHLIVRVAPGVAPAETDNGRLTLAASPSHPDLAATEAAIADTFDRWNVSNIAPTTTFQLKNTALARQLGLDRYYTIHLPDGSDTPTLTAELAQFQSHVELAELDLIGGALQTFPNDEHFDLQYALHNTGQNVEGQPGIADADIDAPEAWDLHTGTSDIILAIIDTGVSESHPDLAGKLVQGRNFTGSDPDDTDDSWLISHGSHCAGIAGAMSNNTEGVTGVGWGISIMPVKVLNWMGGGEISWCADGAMWAADNGAHVGSMSLGFPESTSYLQNAMAYAHGQGMVLVAATGNTPGDPVAPPARYDTVIAVGATDNRDNLADFTTTGPEMSVTAPGVNCYSCWDVLFNSNTYSYQSGTSMACPHVAGLCALVKSANPNLTNLEIQDIIESTAEDKGTPGWDPSFGFGRVNAFAAIQAAITPQYLPGDMNCDGVIDNFDIDPFVLALTDPAAYDAAFPDCDRDLGDINGDGTLDNFDIDPFVALITG